MNTRSATIHTRIQPKLKQRAEKIFADSGHTPSDVLEQFYIQTVRRGKVPIKLNKRRAKNPDEALMTADEIREMLSKSSQMAKDQIASGDYITTDNIKDKLNKQYAIDL